MKRGCLSLLLLALLLAGCANLGQIRQSDPVATLDSQKSPKELANAIAYESQKDLDSFMRNWDPAVVTETSGVYKILVTGPYAYGAGKVPRAEITITAKPGGGSHLEYRTPYSLRTFFGGHFWSLIQHCATPPGG